MQRMFSSFLRMNFIEKLLIFVLIYQIVRKYSFDKIIRSSHRGQRIILVKYRVHDIITTF